MSDIWMDWRKTYENSGYRIDKLASISKIDEGSLRRYFAGHRFPRKNNLEKMEKLMKTANDFPRLKFHPSYGYATEEQIERLKHIGVGADMDYLLKQIAEQTRNRGKFK